MKKLALIIAFLIAMPAVFAADLTEYPEFFTGVSIVVGDNAPAQDVQNAIDLAQVLQNEDLAVSVRTANEFSSATHPIISIGNPTDNAITNDIIGEDTITLEDGSARLKVFEYSNTKQVVAYGNTPEATAKAVYILMNWKDYPLETAETVVSGTIPELTLYKVVPLIDHTCGDTQTYQYGDVWPEACISTTTLQYFPDIFAPEDTSSDDTTGDDTTDDDTTGDDTTGDDTTDDDTTGDDTTGDDTSDDVIVTPGASLSFETFTLGGSKQDRGETVSQDFVLTNTGTVSLTGFTFSGIDSKYNFEIEGFPTSLLSGQTVTLTANSYVPLDHDAVDNKCEETSHSIGTLTISTAEGASALQNPKMQAVNELRILDVRADIRGEDRRIEGRTTDVYWDEEIDVHVEVQNRFSDDDDVEGQDQDIDVNIEVDGDTDELDLDEDSADVNADSEEELTLNGRVEDDARNNIKLILTAEGTDEEGAEHCDETVIRFDVIEQYLPGPAPTIRFENQETQTTQPTVESQPEPREESVEVITPEPVAETKFRNSKAYVALLSSMIVLMLAVIAAEMMLIKRRKTLLAESYEDQYQQE